MRQFHSASENMDMTMCYGLVTVGIENFVF